MKNYKHLSAAPWRSNYITYRRFLLDSYLTASTSEMEGVVLDLGGKRNNKRGTFQPPEQQTDKWLYLNLDLQTRPDIFSDVTIVPIKSEIADCIICTEVLEHLPNPQDCVDEMHRLLRTGGVALVSIPFFYPVHSDPYDFQRFTEDGLRNIFCSFTSVEVYRMGGYTGVLGLLLETGINGVEGSHPVAKLTRWAMKWISRWLCRHDLQTFGSESPAWQKFTTGYFVKAVK